MSCHFWPFTQVQNGNQREVMTKWENFLRPKETKAGKTLFGSIRVKAVFLLFLLAKAFGVAFCYKGLLRRAPPSAALSNGAIDWMTVEAAVSALL